MKRILFAAGGTGGHLFPALAVAEMMKEINGDLEIAFAGSSSRIESKIIPNTEFQFIPLPIGRFPGSLIGKAKFALEMIKSIATCTALIKSNKIDAVVCAGAYISFPAGYAAKRTKTPLFLMESNYNIGKTNKYLAKYARCIFTSFPETKNAIEETLKYKVIETGNPLRKQFSQVITREKSKELIGVNPNKKMMLILGGSLGARSINRAILHNLQVIESSPHNYIWQTGDDAELYEKLLPTNLPKNLRVEKFISSIYDYINGADLLLCRSGASTISEITALGRASVLVPLPSASNNEQMLNAKYLASNLAAKIVSDSQLKDNFESIVNEVLTNDILIKSMSSHSLQLGKPNATMSITSMILKEIGG